MASMCTTTLVQEIAPSLCLVSNGQMARESGQLNRSKDRCEDNHVSLPPRARYALPSTGVYSGVTVCWCSTGKTAEPTATKFETNIVYR
ncbi:hypothetical protein AVEN_128988-1 [Araneus ventricosus]|uniref:Uncharacterized protein n=1 Tax=Araneus ventricosus TaxID=182803 RepID=A0A4Y2G9S5_ARAVE|nr:hypothetical protein AVEN_128988-1 [Araneus ventricosus]